jgi:hypothetical protein
MKTVLALLSLALVAFAAGNTGYRAQFVGGTLAGVPAKSKAQLNLTAPDALIFACGGQTLSIGYAKIDTLEYGQNVSRRYAAALVISPLFLLSKSRQHFVTIGYTDRDGKQQALVFRVDKRDVRTVLTTLEARSGGAWNIRMKRPERRADETGSIVGSCERRHCGRPDNRRKRIAAVDYAEARLRGPVDRR